MNGILDLLLTAQLLLPQVPAGTAVHIRLLTPVGSYASRVGTPVRGVVIAPVAVHGETLIPAGTTVSGQIQSINRVGFGFVHETAAVGMVFTRFKTPGGQVLPFLARVSQVDNARERVTKDGVIHGVRSTASLCYRTSGYIRTALGWEIHAEVAEWIIRALLVQVPEPEIYFPPGVELTLSLTRPLARPRPAKSYAPVRLSGVERVNLNALVEQLPSRAFAPSSRPSDVVNILFLGSREELTKAFSAAGWTEPQRVSIRSDILDIRAVAEGRGYRRAPMSSLFVNHAEPNLSWEKGFNDASKRDHIRIWKQPETWGGYELWVGAATRDVNFAFFRPGQSMTHKVERDVDVERDKVANDLAFTSCVDVEDYLDRPLVPHLTRNATGDTLTTDGRAAVLVLNGCAGAHTGLEDGKEMSLPVHGGGLQRFVRREILSMRSDLLRANIYYRCYEGGRWLVEAAVRRQRRLRTTHPTEPDPPVLLQRAGASAASPAS